MTDDRRRPGGAKSRDGSIRNRALATLVALLLAVLLPTGAASATSTTVGYIGCSLTWQTVNGYHTDGGTRLWPPISGYGGGEIPKWSDDIASATPKYWPIFQRMLTTSPADTFWIEACFQTGQIRPANLAQAEAVVRHIRELVPGATIYFSAMNGWDPPDSCGKASSAAVAKAHQVTDALVAEGLALRGPLMPVLATTITLDGCHPDAAGETLLGQALKGFFDAPPPASTGPVFTQTPTDPSGSLATFAFTADGSGLTFRCSLDGAPAAVCTSPVNLLGLSGGAHAFSVRARSALDTQSSPPATFSWSVDATPPPSPTFVSTPPSVSSGTRAKFAFTDAETGVSFTCSLDGAPQSACSSPAALFALSPGQHAFRVRAVDGVGNRSLATAFSWRVVDATTAS
jgi:hypothetical protein